MIIAITRRRRRLCIRGRRRRRRRDVDFSNDATDRFFRVLIDGQNAQVGKSFQKVPVGKY